MTIHTSIVDPLCPVNWSHPLNRGLIGRWQVIPNAGWQGGNTWFDLVNGGKKPNNATLNNMEVTDWIGNKAGRPGGFGALDFGGTDEYASISTIDSQLDGLTACTLMMWVYRHATGTVASMGRGTSSSNNRFGFQWYTDNNVYHTLEAGATSFPNYSSTATGWHWLAMVFDGSLSGLSRCASYLDAIRKTLGTGGASPPTAIATNTGMAIGRFSNATTTFTYDTNLRDDVRIYNVALSAQEITAIYLESMAGCPETLNWYRPRAWSIVSAATPWLYARRNSQLIGGGLGL